MSTVSVHQSFPALWSSLQRGWANLFGHDLFLSYARSDGSAAADALEREFASRGFLTFRDQSGLEGAAELTPEIRRAVRRCRLLVVLVTPGAGTSPWVSKEVALRLAPRRRGWRRWPRRRRVYPIFWGGVRPEELPARLQRLGDSLGWTPPAPAAVREFPAAEVAEAIAAVFGGWRQRVWLRLAVGVVAAAVAGLGIGTWEQRAAARRGAEAARWEQEAGTAEAGLRFDEAEHALARAAAADGRVRGQLWPRYLQARGRRRLTPRARVDLLEGCRAVWLAERANGEPVLLTHHEGDHRMELRDARGIILSWPVTGTDAPLAGQSGENVFVFAGGTLWKFPVAPGPVDRLVPSLTTGLDAENYVDTMAPVELQVRGGHIRLLGRKGETWHVVEVESEAFTVLRDIPLPRPEEADTVLRLAHTEEWLALGAALPHGSRAVDVVGWNAEGQHRTLRTVPGVVSPTAILPDLDTVAVAPDDAQIFLAYHVPEFLNPGTRQDGSDTRWLAVDLATPRPPWSLEPRIAEVTPLPTHRRFEAVYQTENKALHALSFIDFVVLDRPPRDLLPRAAAWVVLPARPTQGREDCEIAAVTSEDDRLVLLQGAEPCFATPLPVQTRESVGLGLLVSSAGRHLALRVSSGIVGEGEIVLIWDLGAPPDVKIWPDPASLESTFHRLRTPSKAPVQPQP